MEPAKGPKALWQPRKADRNLDRATTQGTRQVSNRLFNDDIFFIVSTHNRLLKDASKLVCKINVVPL